MFRPSRRRARSRPPRAAGAARDPVPVPPFCDGLHAVPGAARPPPSPWYRAASLVSADPTPASDPSPSNMEKTSASQDKAADKPSEDEAVFVSAIKRFQVEVAANLDDLEDASSSEGDGTASITPPTPKDSKDSDPDFDAGHETDSEEPMEVASLPQKAKDSPMPESSGTLKRKRGQRGPNKMPGGINYIMDISQGGIPLGPSEAVNKFRSAQGFLVREHVPITCLDWRLLDEKTRNKIWGLIEEKFKFPEGMKDAVKKATFVSMGRKFRRWKAEMNAYAKRNEQPPPQKMGKITQAQWDDFCRQKTTPEALSLSQTNSEKAKMNECPHHLGSTGYAPKVSEWKQKIDEIVSSDNPNPLEGLDERSTRWVMARADLTREGKLVPKTPKVAEVQNRLKEVVEQQKQGRFKPQRENDQLTAALGNPEHTGRVRAISAQMSWKEGFPEDAESYKKRDRYKKKLEQNILQTIDEKVEACMTKVFQRFRESGLLTREVLQQPREPGQLTREDKQDLAQSSEGSTPLSASEQRFPVGDIVADTPCRLRVPMGRSKQKKIEVATGKVRPGRTFHGHPVPINYIVVLVLKITATGFEDLELEHSTPEGITTLGQAVNEFILWHRDDIALVDDPLSPSAAKDHKHPPLPSHKGHKDPEGQQE